MHSIKLLIQSFPPLPSYLSDQGTIWPDQLDLSAFQKPKYHLSKCSFDLIQTNRVESNSILMSSSPLSSSPFQNFWDHFVENFNISQRAQRSFSYFIWSEPIGRGLIHEIKQKSFGTAWDKKILQPKMQTYDKESPAKTRHILSEIKFIREIAVSKMKFVDKVFQIN